MSAIPEDIMKVAEEVVDRIAKVHTWKGDCIADVATAILAERERSRTALSEADQRVKDARRVALEEAAKIAEVSADDLSMAELHAERRVARHIYASISALQSEER